MTPEWSPDDPGTIPGRFQDDSGIIQQMYKHDQKWTNILQHFCQQWTSYETSGQTDMVEMMANGSSRYDLFIKNSQKTRFDLYFTVNGEVFE